MIVRTIRLRNFRNHNYLTYDFHEGLNIITGPNGSGKTNIVEAIYYLSLARSFRTNEDNNLIGYGKNDAQIEAIVQEGKIKRTIKVVFTRDSRKVFINDKAVRKISDLAKITNVLVFEPKDVMLFKGLPKARRNFLDINISKKSEPYLEYITRYEKVLKERNEILKQDKVNEELLSITTELLIKLSGPIVSYRQMYVKDINDILNKITRALTGENNKIEVIYKPFVTYNQDFEDNAKEAFEKTKESDIKHKVTSIGIQREDFSVLYNGKDIAEHGSQGENRIVALALKLSPYFLIEDKEKRPVIALDDVMSELDQSHRLKLINFLKKFEQVFITATKLEIDGASHYKLNKRNKEVL